MTLPAPTYDLTLVLDPQAADDARAKIVADARAAISSDGELLRHDDWGERPLAYPIERRTSGEYHLMQFHAGRAELLQGLDRNLRITDGILRFRIIRLAPGVAEPPDMRGTAPARPTGESAAADAPAPPAAPAQGEAPAAANGAPVEPAPPVTPPEASAEDAPAEDAPAPAAAPGDVAAPDAAPAETSAAETPAAGVATPGDDDDSA